MDAQLRSSGLSSTATPSLFRQVNAIARKRVEGPADYSVRVLLLEDVHFLAAVLDPNVFDAQAADVAHDVGRAFRAVSTFFSRSPQVFSATQLERGDEDQRLTLGRDQFTTYTALSGTSDCGAYAARRPGSAVNIRKLINADWDLWGWWTLFGGSTPELRAIGKALAGMSPCTGAVERSFSLQKSIHSLVHNRLVHARVAKHMFVHTNLSLFGEVDLAEEDPDFTRSVAEEGDSGDEGDADEGGQV